MSDIVDQLAFVIKYGNLHAIPQEVVSKAAAEITRLRAENERLSTSLSNTANARIVQGKAIAELSAENERLRWMVRRLQERTRQLIQDNKLLAHDDTAEWGLEELMKDVGDSNE